MEPNLSLGVSNCAKKASPEAFDNMPQFDWGQWLSESFTTECIEPGAFGRVQEADV